MPQGYRRFASAHSRKPLKLWMAKCEEEDDDDESQVGMLAQAARKGVVSSMV